MNSKVFTIPNMVSLSRLVIAWPLAYAIYHHKLLLSFILGAIAIFSDFFDGYLSRILNQSSPFGKVIDPIVDSIIVLAVMVALHLRALLPAWYLKLIILRYLILFLLLSVYSLRAKHPPQSILSGKLSMCMIALTLMSALFQHSMPCIHQIILGLSVLSLTISFIDYLYTYRMPV